jgi:hypothetical protein
MRVTSDWRCEERIRPTLDAFFEGWPDTPHSSPEVRGGHYAAVRVLVEELGETDAPVFVRWAKDNIDKRLSVKTTRSLMYLIPEWRRRGGVVPEWQRHPCMKCFTFHAPGDCEDDEPQVILADPSLRGDEHDQEEGQERSAGSG